MFVFEFRENLLRALYILIFSLSIGRARRTTTAAPLCAGNYECTDLIRYIIMLASSDTVFLGAFINIAIAMIIIRNSIGYVLTMETSRCRKILEI